MYKYNCISEYYLNMESGLIPVPDDSKDTYIVVEPVKGDLGLVDNTQEYIFSNGKWEFVREVDVNDGIEEI